MKNTTTTAQDWAKFFEYLEKRKKEATEILQYMADEYITERLNRWAINNNLDIRHEFKGDYYLITFKATPSEADKIKRHLKRFYNLKG